MAEDLPREAGSARALDALITVQRHRIKLVAQLDALKVAPKIDRAEVDRVLATFVRLVAANRIAEEILAEG